MEEIPHQYHEYVDVGVNKLTQNLRLIMCNKLNSDRVKRLTPECADVPIIDTIIQYTEGCKELPSIYSASGLKTDRASAECTLCNDDIDAINEIAEQHGLLDAHVLRVIKRSRLLCYDRIKPSYCYICERTHDSDNTLMLSVDTSSEIAKVYERCRRNDLAADKAKVRYLGQFALIARNADADDNDDRAQMAMAQQRQLVQQQQQQLMIQQQFQHLHQYVDEPVDPVVVETRKMRINNMINNVIKKTPELPDIGMIREIEKTDMCNIYSERSLRPFENKETLCVIAAMKMGKTKNLYELIQREYVDTGLHKHSIIFLSFRQTFSANIKEKFSDFTLYSDVPTGELRHLRLIVQIESFHRMALDPNTPVPDLIVIDESELIFEQFNSGLLKQFKTAWSKFQWYISMAKHVICMDAAMSDRTINILRQLRKDKPIFIHHNKFQNAVDDKYYVTADKPSFYAALYDDLKHGKKVAIATSSLQEAKILQKNISDKFPEICIGFYSSETSATVKKAHFGNVDTAWSSYDVLIYTPTVSAGVSYESKRFDVIYAWFNDMSCNVEVCLQMIGRVRDVKERRYVIGVEVSGGYLPTTREGIIESMYRDRQDLFWVSEESFLQFQYTAEGFKKYIEDEYFHLFVENRKVRNISQNGFVKRFIALVKVYGATCYNIADMGVDLNPMLLKAIEKENRDTSSDIKEVESNAIANAPDISEKELTDILELKSKQVDISEDIRAKYERYKLRHAYNYGGAINSDFVRTYRQRHKITAFRNLTSIMRDDDVKTALDMIQREQRERLQLVLSDTTYESQYADFSHRYDYNKHLIAMGIIQLCGWENLRSRKYISELSLFEKFSSTPMSVYNNINNHHNIFKIAPPEMSKFRQNTRRYEDFQDPIVRDRYVRSYVDYIVTYFNKILTSMYDITIRLKRREQLYQLDCPRSHFIIDKNIDPNEYEIPCIYAKWKIP